MQKINEITAEEIVAPMIGNHPEVRPNAVMAEQKQHNSDYPASTVKNDLSKSSAEKKEVFKDKTGEKFNPEKHFSDKYGRPQFTNGGYFRKIPIQKQLKRQAMKVLGRPDPESENPNTPESEQTEEPKLSEPSAEQAQTPEQTEEPKSEQQSFIPEDRPRKPGPSDPSDEFTAAAKALCSTIFTVGVSIGGVQCKPLPQHVESMESSWEQYFRQRGKIDVPPGIAVALSTGGYALFCYQSSQLVQEQIGGIRGWIISKIGGWKTRRASRRAKNPE